MNSLAEVKAGLSEAVGNEALFSLINTRLMLRSGVDLKSVSERDARDPAVIAKVLSTLGALGFTEDALRTAASKRTAK